MGKLHGANRYPELSESVRANCEACCGLCCTMLYFAKSDGFPKDKPAGVPCGFLQTDFRCGVHAELAERKYKGCMAYDCLGAGQKVTQEIYGGHSFREQSVPAEEMAQVFLKVWQLQQILCYLLEAASLLPAEKLWDRIDEVIADNQWLSALPPEELALAEVDEHRLWANALLKEAWALVQQMLKAPVKTGGGDYLGRKFKKANLSGWDFSVSLLIGADLSACQLFGTNLLGADIRDAKLADADLSECLFLTQSQLNTAQGNAQTKLPAHLLRPEQWVK